MNVTSEYHPISTKKISVIEMYKKINQNKFTKRQQKIIKNIHIMEYLSKKYHHVIKNIMINYKRYAKKERLFYYQKEETNTVKKKKSPIRHDLILQNTEEASMKEGCWLM